MEFGEQSQYSEFNREEHLRMQKLMFPDWEKYWTFTSNNVYINKKTKETLAVYQKRIELNLPFKDEKNNKNGKGKT